jgi:Xaa-Pro aminopeptidase
MFRERREQFMRQMQGGLAVFCSAPVSNRNSDVEYEYRQDSDFYYLTGFDEPEAVAVLAPEQPERRFTLFVRPRDKEKEVWTGRRAGVEGAERDFGADKAFTLDELDKELLELARSTDALYYRFGRNEEFNRRVVGLLRSLQQTRARTGAGVVKLIDPGLILHEMRLVKTAGDLAVIRRAVDISCEAHIAAMRTVRPGLFEYELEALIEYIFRRNGCPSPGYPTIVGAGANATILHYTANSDRIKDGDLVLVDAGAEFGYYTGDLTRTFPANGRFSEPQREIYQLVLEAQVAAIELVMPGATAADIHDRAVEVLTTGLVRLGLLEGATEELIENGAYRKFYMHRTGHWLGMDVHDVGVYQVGGNARPLAPGMVLTVEPGLYVSEDPEVDPRYWNIGVRIEDDVLVTGQGHEVLSAAAPKSVAAVEE